VPMVLNTSFNRHGIATISSPRQSIEHLLSGNIDMLYLDKDKIEFKKNRKYKANRIKTRAEKNLLKLGNYEWLKKNKHIFKTTTINKIKRKINKL